MKEIQDRVKIKRTKMEGNMNISELDKLDFIMDRGKIDDQDLFKIFELNEREHIITFLEKYNDFTVYQFSLIEDFINNNLNDSDRDFVSDLIDIASDWSLNLNYEMLLSFLSNDKEDEHFVILSTINYVTENLKLFYYNEILDLLKKILDNSNYYQNVQISSALCLFRITGDLKFIEEIKYWIIDDATNKEFVQNKLKSEYYINNFFGRKIKEILIDVYKE